MDKPRNATAERLVSALEGVLKVNGFATKRRLVLYDTTFDVIAEDAARLVFVTVRSDNDGWLDDFHDEQAALGAAAEELRLGRKWRDVYLIEVTTDALDTPGEKQSAQEIRGNTFAARKLVIDAGSVDPDEPGAVADLIQGFIIGPRTDTIHSDVDVLERLRGYLVEEGFDDDLIASLIQVSSSDSRHSCVQIILEKIAHET
jgi:hypothetical protein